MSIEKIPPLPEHKTGIKYEYPGDAIALFSSPKKLVHFLVFMLSKLRHLEVRFYNGNLKMMPCVFFASETRAEEEFFAIDYLYFLKIIADYIHEYELGNPFQFIDDYLLTSDYDDTKRASVFLFAGFFETVLRIAYINGLNTRTQGRYLEFATNAVYENDKVAIEFAAINFKFKDILRVTENEELVKEMKRISKVSNVQQLAYGKKRCFEYWDKKKKKPVYFMSHADVKIR